MNLHYKNKQRGFASIVIALTLVIVLALLTVGFSQLARREQQSALNKQLAAQAQYAAESGVDKAIENLDSLSDTNDCDPTDGITGPINSSSGTSVTCVKINKKPQSLYYSNVEADTSKYVTFKTSSPMDVMKIEWSRSAGGANFPNDSANTKFLPQPEWADKGYPAVIQFSITPLTSMNRDELQKKMFTAFLYPSRNGSPVTPYAAPANTGKFINGGCTGNVCSAEISNIPGGTGPYLIHMLNLYDKSNIKITATKVGVGSNAVSFIDGQAIIDVTAKARDVLKRVQVRVPLVDSPQMPAYGIEAQNICKRLRTGPDGTTLDYGAVDGVGSPNPCDLPL